VTSTVWCPSMSRARDALGALLLAAGPVAGHSAENGSAERNVGTCLRRALIGRLCQRFGLGRGAKSAARNSSASGRTGRAAQQLAAAAGVTGVARRGTGGLVNNGSLPKNRGNHLEKRWVRPERRSPSGTFNRNPIPFSSEIRRSNGCPHQPTNGTRHQPQLSPCAVVEVSSFAEIEPAARAVARLRGERTEGGREHQCA